MYTPPVTISPLQHLVELESELLQEESQVPVYFTKETPTLLDIYNDVKVATNSDQAGSAAEGMCPWQPC